MSSRRNISTDVITTPRQNKKRSAQDASFLAPRKRWITSVKPLTDDCEKRIFLFDFSFGILIHPCTRKEGGYLFFSLCRSSICSMSTSRSPLREDSRQRGAAISPLPSTLCAFTQSAHARTTFGSSSFGAAASSLQTKFCAKHNNI